MRVVQSPVVGRTVFQMDQAASAHKTFLRNVRECGQGTDLDRGEHHVLVAIIKKRLNLDASLYTLLQILSLTLFEKMPLQQAFPADGPGSSATQDDNQLNLFDSNRTVLT